MVPFFEVFDFDDIFRLKNFMSYRQIFLPGGGLLFKFFFPGGHSIPLLKRVIKHLSDAPLKISPRYHYFYGLTSES